MKPTFSRGPWSLDADAKHPWRVVAGYEDGLPGWATIAEVGYKPNAQLIAQAPAMLEGLQGAAALFRRYADEHQSKAETEDLDELERTTRLDKAQRNRDAAHELEAIILAAGVSVPISAEAGR